MQTQSFIADPYADEQAQIKQNLAYAQQLQAQGLQPLEGQMVSNRFVAPSPVQGLANILKSYMGRKGQENAMRMDASLTNRKIADQTGEIAALMAEPDIGKRAAMAMQSRLPGVQALGSTFLAEQLKSDRLREKLGAEPPKVQEVTEGSQTVSRQWDPVTRTFTEIGRGDRFRPERSKLLTPDELAQQKELRAAGAAQISTYGSPVQGVDRVTGEPVFIQPDNRGGEPRVLKDVKPAPKTNLTPKEVQTAKSKIMAANNLLRQIAIVEKKFTEAQKDKTATGFIIGKNPVSEKGRAFDAAVNAMRSSVTAATRVPGVGSMSDFETKLDQSKMPSRDEYNSVTLQQIQEMKDLANGMLSGYSDMLPDATPTGPPGNSVLDQADAILRGGKLRGGK